MSQPDPLAVVRTQAIAQRAIEPRPSDDNKYRWQRRFTSLVSMAMAARDQGRPVTPSEAGSQASRQLRREWVEVHPGKPEPDWMASIGMLPGI